MSYPTASHLRGMSMPDLIAAPLDYDPAMTSQGVECTGINKVQYTWYV